MSEGLQSRVVQHRHRVACLGHDAREICTELVNEFREAGRRLAREALAPPTGGSLSVRLDHGFAVTCQGCHLPTVRHEELVWVRECDLEQEIVRYIGGPPPSSDALLHHRVLSSRPDCGALVFARTLTPIRLDGCRGIRWIPEMDGDILGLAHQLLEMIDPPCGPIVVGRHAYLAGSCHLEDAVSAVLDLHRRLASLRAGN